MPNEVLVVGKFFPSVMNDLQQHFSVVHCENADALAEMSNDQLANIEGFATFGWAPASVIDRMPNLKLISSFGVGYDGVDADHAAAKGVIVTHTPDVLNDDVANTTIMLLLATMRHMVEQDRYPARRPLGKRKAMPPLTRSIAGKVVGNRRPWSNWGSHCPQALGLQLHDGLSLPQSKATGGLQILRRSG